MTFSEELVTTPIPFHDVESQIRSRKHVNDILLFAAPSSNLCEHPNSPIGKFQSPASPGPFTPRTRDQHKPLSAMLLDNAAKYINQISLDRWGGKPRILQVRWVPPCGNQRFTAQALSHSGQTWVWWLFNSLACSGRDRPTLCCSQDWDIESFTFSKRAEDTEGSEELNIESTRASRPCQRGQILHGADHSRCIRNSRPERNASMPHAYSRSRQSQGSIIQSSPLSESCPRFGCEIGHRSCNRPLRRFRAWRYVSSYPCLITVPNAHGMI